MMFYYSHFCFVEFDSWSIVSSTNMYVRRWEQAICMFNELNLKEIALLN